MSKSSLKLLLACFISLATSMPATTQAQLWKNTPFDTRTWDPSDWTNSPTPPSPPKMETIIVRNTGTKTVSFAYGNGRTVSGWVNVRGGQTESRTISLSNGKAYLLIARSGEPIKIGDRRTHYVPYHPQKSFKLVYQGNGDYGVTLGGMYLGVFNRKSLAQLGFSGEYFAEIPIEDGGKYTFTAR